MSKAFLRESDYGTDDDPPVAPSVKLPPGAKNLLTPDGARRLREELRRLVEDERPPLAAAGDDREAKRALQHLNVRIRHLEQSLRSAEVIEPPAPPHDTVRFGARVTVREPDGALASYRIVGVDELDAGAENISAHSPLARALLLAHVGQQVRFRAPAGERSLEVIEVAYPDA